MMMTCNELADALKVQPSTIYRLARRGLIPHVRIVALRVGGSSPLSHPSRKPGKNRGFFVS